MTPKSLDPVREYIASQVIGQKNLVDGMLKIHSGESNIIGTIRHIIHGRVVESLNTTPESIQIQSFLKETLEKGGEEIGRTMELTRERSR